MLYGMIDMGGLEYLLMSLGGFLSFGGILVGWL